MVHSHANWIDAARESLTFYLIGLKKNQDFEYNIDKVFQTLVEKIQANLFRVGCCWHLGLRTLVTKRECENVRQAKKKKSFEV